MTHSLNSENGGLAGLVTWIPGQLGVTALASVPVWIAGLRFLWKSQRPLWRPMGFAWALLFVVFALTTGKQIYYLGGAYVYLLAAGTVALDGWLRARPAGCAACWPPPRSPAPWPRCSRSRCCRPATSAGPTRPTRPSASRPTPPRW